MLRTTPDGPARVAGPAEAVQFCRALDRASAALVWSEKLIVAIVLGAAGLFLMPVIRGVQGIGGWSVAVEIGLLCVMLGGVAAFAIVWRRRAARRLALSAANPPLESLPDARVVCAGTAAELAPFGPLTDLPFEPAVFWASFARPMPRRTLWWLVAGGLIAGIVVSFTLRQVVGLRDMIVYPIWVSLALVFVLYAACWPTYLRVTPGRLELLCYSAFRRAPALVREHDLRTCRVIVDLPRRLLFMDPPLTVGGQTTSAEAGQPAAEYCFALVPGAERFAHRVLLGAISRYIAPPLPADELIG